MRNSGTMLNSVILKAFLNKLERIEHGSLSITLPDGNKYGFEGRLPGAKADIHIYRWSVLTRLARKGDIGFAEDYRNGHWESSNLEALVEVALQNRSAFQSYVMGQRFSRLLSYISYLAKLNTMSGSKKNIHAHYDLGNEFYSLWLDKTMTYSAAIFETDDTPLETAQLKKYDRIIEKLNRNTGRLLEVGCGWGGFSERAVRKGDFTIKAITLSEEQHSYAKKTLNSRANVALEDYRAQKGKYDHIVSIEMFEAVGEKFWPTYFGQLGTLLDTKGKAVIQTITIDDGDFENYRRGGDFIRTYIFPGGMLPSRSAFRREAERANLKIGEEFLFGKDYAKTLSLWLESFDKNQAKVRALGFDEGFIRLWRFYLAACAAGFKTGRTDVMQVEVSHA